MVTIRLSRYGHRNAPFYRIVAVDSRKKAVGAVLAFLGTYNPGKKELKVEREKIKTLVQTGAQVSLAVKNLLK